MLENIPWPPPPPTELTAQGAYIAGGSAVLVGLLLVPWGRKLGRGFMVLLGAGAGFALAPLLIARLGTLSENAVRFVAVFALAILALVLARLVWALLAGGLGLLAGLAGVCYRAGDLVLQHRPGEFGPSQSFLQWLDSLSGYFSQWGSALAPVLPPALYVFVGACVAVPFLLVLIWPRLGGVMMTALTGAALSVAGGVLLAGKLNVDLWHRALSSGLALACVLGVLALAGWVIQGRSEIRKARSGREDEAQEDQDEPPPPRKGGQDPAGGNKKKGSKGARSNS